MPPKRKRLLNSSAEQKLKANYADREVWSARGRLQGALLEALEPAAESDSDDSRETSRSSTPPRNAYVLKLFDRSVDLSQFAEDSPLYPVCRAWILNQPRTRYRDHDKPLEGGGGEQLSLPPPSGPVLPRVPPLLPEQLTASKENLETSKTLTRDQLLNEHLHRWGAVREAWLRQARLCETRHAAAHATLAKLHVTL